MQMKKHFGFLPAIGVLMFGLAQYPSFAAETVDPTIRPTTPSSPTTPPTGTGTVSPSSTNVGSVTMSTTSRGDVGEYLIDGTGRSLYVFESDVSGQSTCTEQCAQVWSPLLVQGFQTSNISGTGLNYSLLGVIQRADGTNQVTYNNMPLYYYSEDQSPGDTRGQGIDSFGGKWFLVRPDGNKIVPTVTAPTTGVPNVGSVPTNPSNTTNPANTTTTPSGSYTDEDNNDEGATNSGRYYYGGRRHGGSYGHHHGGYYGGHGGWYGGGYGYGSGYQCYYNGYCCNSYGCYYRGY